MTFLLLEISGYLAVMFVLGIAFGWTIWGRRRKTDAASRRATDTPVVPGTGGASDGTALTEALAKANHEKSVLEARLKASNAS